MKKKALGITLTLAMGLSAQFVQVDSLMTGNMSQAVGMQQAEAGIMNGFAGSVDKMKHKAVSSAKKEAKNAVKKALDIDVNGMENHHAQMIKHLMMAARFTTQASMKYDYILGKKDNNVYLKERIANLTPNDTSGLDMLYKFGALPNVVEPGSGKMIEVRLSEADQKKKDDYMQKMAWAKEDRAVATWYKALAARDAVFLVKEAAKGIAQASKSGDHKALLNKLNYYKQVAGDGQKLCTFVGNITGKMDSEYKSIEKNHNVAPVSKARVQQVAKSMMPE